MRFVIADDSPIYRKRLKAYIEAGGHTVVAEAPDGEKAVDACRTHRPDVVVLDYSMPYMTGDEAARIVFAEKTAQHIFLGTSMQAEASLAPLRHVITGVISKPYSREKVLTALERAL